MRKIEINFFDAKVKAEDDDDNIEINFHDVRNPTIKTMPRPNEFRQELKQKIHQVAAKPSKKKEEVEEEVEEERKRVDEDKASITMITIPINHVKNYNPASNCIIVDTRDMKRVIANKLNANIGEIEFLENLISFERK